MRRIDATPNADYDGIGVSVSRLRRSSSTSGEGGDMRGVVIYRGEDGYWIREML